MTLNCLKTGLLVASVLVSGQAQAQSADLGPATEAFGNVAVAALFLTGLMTGAASVIKFKTAVEGNTSLNGAIVMAIVSAMLIGCTRFSGVIKDETERSHSAHVVQTSNNPTPTTTAAKAVPRRTFRSADIDRDDEGGF